MDIFIEPVKKFRSSSKKIIFLKDIAEVFCVGVPLENVKNIQIFKIPNNEYGMYKISSIDIIKSIIKTFPEAKITNTGEKEVLIEYDEKISTENKFITKLKIFSVVIVLFFGTATAIMSFHNDGQIPEIMKGYYNMFFDDENETPYILEIPYSIGIAIGIIVFFNHFGKKKLTMDPTPIEVQMYTYEDEVIKNQLNAASKKEDDKWL